MVIFLDLLSLFAEGNLLTLQVSGTFWWLGAAAVAAGLSFFMNHYFCKLWNRLYKLTIWHLGGFLIAALFAFVAVLAWPASANLETAVNARILLWQNYLRTANVPCEPQWTRMFMDAGKTPPGPEVSWSSGLAFKCRLYAISLGVPQNPIGEQPVVKQDHEGKCERFQFDEAVKVFRNRNPFLGHSLPVDNAEAFKIFTRNVDNSRDSKGSILVSKLTEILGTAVHDVLIPKQTAWLALWVRWSGMTLLVLSMVLPAMLAGLISYFQIRTNFGRRRPASASARPRSVPGATSPVRQYRRR